MNHSFIKTNVLPLQTQAFGDAQACTSGQKRQSTLGFTQVKQNCVCMFRLENHRFVYAPRWENASLGLGVQFFNAFNHPSFGLPSNNIDDFGFGWIFGQPDRTQA
jgi:hypothetical protein